MKIVAALFLAVTVLIMLAVLAIAVVSIVLHLRSRRRIQRFKKREFYYGQAQKVHVRSAKVASGVRKVH